MMALIAATPAVLLASYGPSRVEIVNLKSDLTGSEETPASTGAGTGNHQGPRHCEPQSDRGLRNFDQSYGQGPG
jgi:hypothetical protein